MAIRLKPTSVAAQVLMNLGLKLEEVREEVLATKPQRLEIDVSSVYYLGSSCIKAFVSLTAALKAATKRPTMRVLTSSRLDWQERTFAVLARLAPEIVFVDRVG